MKLKSEKGVHIITVVRNKKYIIFSDLSKALKFILENNHDPGTKV